MPDEPGLRLADGGDLRDLVDAGAAAALVAHLERAQPHAHSDVGSALLDAARALPGPSTAYSPSFGGLRYVLLLRGRTPVAVAFDMQSVALREPGPGVDGARPWEPVPGWSVVELWRPGVPAPDLAALVRRAWEAAA